MRNPREVTEFIIVPPRERGDEIMPAKERFIGYLQRHFPGYSFKVTMIGPADGEGRFGVYPVMNFIGADNRSYMCVEPPTWLLTEVRKVCSSFDVRMSFAA